jgi:hypothetical protein
MTFELYYVYIVYKVKNRKLNRISTESSLKTAGKVRKHSERKKPGGLYEKACIHILERTVTFLCL